MKYIPEIVKTPSIKEYMEKNIWECVKKLRKVLVEQNNSSLEEELENSNILSKIHPVAPIFEKKLEIRSLLPVQSCYILII